METLLTADDVARMFRLGDRQAVYRFAREGVIPSVRIGERKIRFVESSLREWIDEQTGKTKAQNQDDCLTATA